MGLRRQGHRWPQAVDILAARPFYQYKPEPEQSRVRPCLNLVIECKQTDRPYVFFCTGAPHHSSQFPLVAGLYSDCIEIRTDDDESTWILPVAAAMNLSGHPFLVAAPFACTTMSKCVRQGKKLELSGSDGYAQLVLPLVKAARHFVDAEKPNPEAFYFDLHFLVSLAVVDGPWPQWRFRKAAASW